MATRSGDGSAGDADYGSIGASYSRYRQPDARIAARISEALGGRSSWSPRDPSGAAR